MSNAFIHQGLVFLPIQRNQNASKTFPKSIDGRGENSTRNFSQLTEKFLDDFFCVDPKFLSNEQLRDYRNETNRCETKKR